MVTMARGETMTSSTQIMQKLWPFALLVLIACGGGDDAFVPADQNQDAGQDRCVAFDAPSPSAVGLVNAFPHLTFNAPVALLQHPVDRRRWYVVEQSGRVLTFEGEDASAADVFIDIRDRTVSGGEAGLLGMAFHPDFAANHRFYLSYTGAGAPLVSHVSAFTADATDTSADPSNETALLDMPQPFGNHNGGWIAFGPDEFLYIGMGDGGSGGDPENNGQNPRTLLGGLLRIDVDRSDAARGTPYAIPAGNPFSGNLDCSSGDGCPEIYAYGFRNPWRWSFDSHTGDLWVGDVGQGAWEEIDRVDPGFNYGWNIMEGNHCYDAGSCDTTGLVLPVAEYGHDVGISVTGGYVYRGGAMPDLLGDYVFGDFGTGRIWRIVDADQGGTQVELLISSGLNISSFGQDDHGEVYVVSYADGCIYRLANNDEVFAEAPARLSDTGYFSSADLTQPIDCFVPYRVNAPFWSDGAQKARWFGLPDHASINIADGTGWELPAGAVLIKTFLINTAPVETRLLIKHADGQWAGYSYAWRDDLSDADLTTGKTASIGGRTWIFPGPSDCLRCHTTAAGRSLGLETAQLNGMQFYSDIGQSRNQLTYLDDNGLILPHLTQPPDALPALPDPYDGQVAVDKRARAYLHTNCAQCHRPDGPTPSTMDLRATTAVADMNVCDAPVMGSDLGIADVRIIVPGEPDRSILLQRMQRRDAYGMPPLASARADISGAALLSDWITAQTGCP